MAGVEKPGEAGPGIAYEGMVGTEWLAVPDGPVGTLPGWKVSVWDALTGKPVTSVCEVVMRAAVNGLVTADLTMPAIPDGRPACDSQDVFKDDEKRILTWTFPFLVTEVRVARREPDEGALAPKFSMPDWPEPCPGEL